MTMNVSGSVPPNESWRTFDALDLDLAQKADAPLKGRLQELDLATKRKLPMSVTARKTDAYARHTGNTLLFPLHADSMPKYSRKITRSNAAELTDSMKSKIQNEISAVIRDLEYNGLHFVIEFIKFYEHEHTIDPTLSCVEIFHQFQPDSKNEAVTGGSTCVGKALEVVKRLEQIGVKAHVIVNSKGPNEPPIHAAVAIPHQNGILLVEVEHDVPILELKATKTDVRLYPGKPSKEHPRLTAPAHPDLTVSIEIVEVPGNYKTHAPLIVKRENYTTETKTKKNTYAQFVLRPDSNPDQSVMKRWLVGTNFFPVSSHAGEAKEQHAIKVNVAIGYEGVTFNIGDKKFRLPLNAFHQTPDPADSTKRLRRIDRSKLEGDKELKLSKEQLDTFRVYILGKEGDPLGGEFFKAFKTSTDLLLDQVFTIVANKSMLQDLRSNLNKVK